MNSGKVQVALKDGGPHGCPYNEYAPPTGIDGETGYDIKDKDKGLPYYRNDKVECQDADYYTSANPLRFDPGPYTEKDKGKTTRFVVTQMILKPDTSFGLKPVLHNFFKWREI